MSWFTDNADAILEKAEGCETLAELWAKLGWPDFQSVIQANKELELGIPLQRPGRMGAPREAQAVAKSDLPIPGKRKAKGGTE